MLTQQVDTTVAETVGLVNDIEATILNITGQTLPDFLQRVSSHFTFDEILLASFHTHRLWVGPWIAPLLILTRPFHTWTHRSAFSSMFNDLPFTLVHFFYSLRIILVVVSLCGVYMCSCIILHVGTFWRDW